MPKISSETAKRIRREASELQENGHYTIRAVWARRDGTIVDKSL